jgi:hypothetical protein
VTSSTEKSSPLFSKLAHTAKCMQAAHLVALEKRNKTVYITLLLVNAKASKTLVKVGVGPHHGPTHCTVRLEHHRVLLRLQGC